MSRRIVSLFVVMSFLVSALLATDLPARWRSWRYSRPLPVAEGSNPAEIVLPLEIFPHSENYLSDLRVIDDTGAEVPYILIANEGHPTQESRAVTLRENSYAPGQYTQVIADLGGKPAFHNTVRIETPESDFINWVQVSASDDARTWRIVKQRAPISRFRRENLEGNQTIRYSENNARYLRLRIFESAKQFPVTGAEVFFATVAREPERKPLPVTLAPDPSAPPTLSRWNADFGTDHFPVSEIAFATSQPEFYRAVRVLTSEDAREWQFSYGGEIYRYKVGDKLEESLRVGLGGSWGPRYWRVEIINANDAPLIAAQPSFLTTTRTLYFYPQSGRAYRLLYGNARAHAPQYDLSRIAHPETSPKLAAIVILPGPEEATSNYADPRPFTERHPNLLWLALGIAVVLLAYTALRALRSPASPAE